MCLNHEVYCTIPYSLSLRSDPDAVCEGQPLVENPGDVERAAFPLDHEVGNRQSLSDDSCREKCDLCKVQCDSPAWLGICFARYRPIIAELMGQSVNLFILCHAMHENLNPSLIGATVSERVCTSAFDQLKWLLDVLELTFHRPGSFLWRDDASPEWRFHALLTPPSILLHPRAEHAPQPCWIVACTFFKV